MQTVATQQTQSQEKTSSSPDRSKEETQDKKGLLRLQRLIGNQAAQRITRAGTEKPTAPCCFDKTAFTIPRIQRKPTISSPDDPFEREADDVADTVMRMTDPGAVTSAPVAIQRKCMECEDEEKIQTAPATDTETEPDTELAVSATGQSRPLPREARDFFEPRFGRDFGAVRIHSDGHAATAARAVKSRAYTLGRDIVFNQGEYAPDTEGGKRLLAHELAHVVQQGHAQSSATVAQPTVQRQEEEEVADNSPVPTQGKPTDPKGPLDPPDQEKPAPKDPDADCMGCKPITKITKKAGAVTTIFGLCDDKFDVFNTGAGTPQPGPGCLPVSTNTTSMINFRTGNPGWQTTAKIKDCTIPPPAPNAPTQWEIGFIQTLESATYGAAYDNNSFIKVTNKDARDALTATVAAPWYDAKGNSLGPQDYPTVPMINDTPNVSFRVTHPANAKNWLRSVCMKAKFHTWLIINKKGTTPTATNVDFFYNWNIDIDQSHALSGPGAHPCNISQWTSTGSQTISSKGPGKGSATPVWDKPIALSNSVTDTTTTSDPCGSSGTSTPDAPKEKPKDPQSQ